MANAVQEYDKLKKLAADARMPFDKDFLLNIAFFLDQQYSVWNGDQNAVMTAPSLSGGENAPRPVVNKITHYVMKQRASALESRPTIDVLPASDDPQDLSIASVALNYLNWLGEPQVADLDGELADAVLWALAGGEGYLKWSWNAAEKRPDIMACSGTEVYGDPYAKKFKYSRYAIHEQFIDVDQARTQFGDNKIQPTARSRADIMKSAVLRDMGVAPVLEGVLVNELWLRPGVDHRWPNGKLCIWAGNTILHEEEYPYLHGKLPFTQIGSIPRPGSPHYTCPVKFLRAPQMELNKYHAQRIAVRQMFSNPKWWIPTELELEAPPDDSYNQILRGNSSGGTYQPSLIQPTVFPENSDGDWIKSEMDDVSGQHETSRGQVPGRVEAARAIEMLKQADDSGLAELQRTIGSAISQGGYMALMLLSQFGEDEQIVQTYSREGLPEVKRFKKEHLRPGISVRVGQTSGLATTRAAKQDLAILLWQNQIITDPDVMADLMDIPVGRSSPGKANDVRLARNENLVMSLDDPETIKKMLGKSELTDAEKNGVALTPNSWDEHDIHIREHNDFRKTSEFDTLTVEAQQKFEFHVQNHQDLRLAKMKKDMEEAALAQGVGAAPPGGGTMPDPATAEDPSAPAEDQAAASPIAGMPPAQ